MFPAAPSNEAGGKVELPPRHHEVDDRSHGHAQSQSHEQADAARYGPSGAAECLGPQLASHPGSETGTAAPAPQGALTRRAAPRRAPPESARGRRQPGALKPTVNSV